MSDFLTNPQGWWYFTVAFGDTANPVWPIFGNPIGAGHRAVSATAPTGALTGAGKKLILRAVLFENTSDMNVLLRQGDGSTAYFDGAVFNSGSGGANSRNLLAIPLHNGLCAIATAGTIGRAIICYESLDF